MRTMPLSIIVPIIAAIVVAVVTYPALATVRAQPTHAETLVVVANPGLGVHDIPFSTLRRVFSGETTELAGKRLIPLNHPPNNEARRRFDLVVLKLTPEMLGPYWVDRRLRGQNGPPKTVPDASLLLAVVARLAGAIGYVSAAAVPENVELLKVDGKAPTDAGYPLR